MKRHLFGTSLASLAITVAAHGGTFVEEFLPTTDLGSGIDSSKIYTHAIDWGSDAADPGGPGADVNGVHFTEGTFGDFPALNYSFFGPDLTFQDNPSNNYDGGSGMFDLTDDFLFTGTIGTGVQTLTLTGLIGGATYTITHYQSAGWNGALQILDGDDDGLGFNTGTFDRGDPGSPRAIHYTYTQALGDTDFVMTFDPENDVDSFHHYAFTNEVVALPEPASITLFGLAAFGLLARRRRS
ncbi:MAG: PEP-CTERM sorting domain-containing protein [Chthoniobacteraceae bacterium]